MNILSREIKIYAIVYNFYNMLYKRAISIIPRPEQTLMVRISQSTRRTHQMSCQSDSARDDKTAVDHLLSAGRQHYSNT